MTSAMMRVFTMLLGKKYLFSYDSKDMDDQSPDMAVVLISEVTLYGELEQI